MSTSTPTMAEVARAIGADVDMVTTEQALIGARADLYKCVSHDIVFDTASGTFTRTRRTLRLGKRVPEDWAALLWTENATVTAGEDGSRESQFLAGLFGPKRAPLITEGIERSMGLGTVGLDLLWDYRLNWLGKVKSASGIRLDVTDAYGVIPLAFDKTGVSEVAFVSYGKNEVFVREHREGKVVNRYFTYHGSLVESALPDGIAAEVPVDGAASFALLKPAIASGMYIGYPYGASVLDSAQDHIRVADLCFDNFGADFELGMKRVFMADSLLRKNADGTGHLSPDRSMQQVYLAMRDPVGEGTVATGITEYNPDLRVEDNRQGVNTALALVSWAVGFGDGYYSFDGGSGSVVGGAKTAYEVMSQNSDLYRMRRKHFLAVAEALETVARAALVVGKQYGGQSLDVNAEIRVVADDSVIEDDKTRRDDGLNLYRSGVLSRKKFLTDYMHMTEKEALAEMAEMAPTIPGLV